MNTHTITFREKNMTAHETMSLVFDSDQPITFRAGQYVDLTLINPGEIDTKGTTYTFSLSSAPHEPLTITTRQTPSAMKRVLAGLQPGQPVTITRPMGSFTLHENRARPAVFLAGGIGVTPIRSMISDAIYKNLLHEMYLFHSNRTGEDTVFKDELENWAREHKNFHLVHTVTQEKNQTGEEAGRITYPMIQKYLPPHVQPIYYIVGSPSFTNALWQELVRNKISADDIRSEDFAGY